MPDLLVIDGGITFYLELKNGNKGQPTELQLLKHEELRRHGAYVEVVRTFARAEQIAWDRPYAA